MSTKLPPHTIECIRKSDNTGTMKWRVTIPGNHGGVWHVITYAGSVRHFITKANSGRRVRNATVMRIVDERLLQGEDD